jgi:hypothetical protein
MTSTTTTPSFALMPSLERAWQDVDRSFDRFCLTAGIGAIEQMLGDDAQQLTGGPYSRGEHRVGQRWGTTKGKIGFHGGKVAVHRPRVRSYDGREVNRRPPQAADAAAALARLHQRDRQCVASAATRSAGATPRMALRWAAAGMLEAAKGFRRLKAHKYLPVLRAALAVHHSKYVPQRVERNADAA